VVVVVVVVSFYSFNLCNLEFKLDNKGGITADFCRRQMAALCREKLDLKTPYNSVEHLRIIRINQQVNTQLVLELCCQI
jgi:hypothetical protein